MAGGGGTAGSGGSAGGGGMAGGAGMGPSTCPYTPPTLPGTFPANWTSSTVITFNDDGAWTWYSDERVVVDLVLDTYAQVAAEKGLAVPR